MLYLLRFDFTLEYVLGKKGKADELSRSRRTQSRYIRKNKDG